MLACKRQVLLSVPSLSHGSPPSMIYYTNTVTLTFPQKMGVGFLVLVVALLFCPALLDWLARFRRRLSCPLRIAR
jgi:hypothetical protein